MAYSQVLVIVVVIIIVIVVVIIIIIIILIAIIIVIFIVIDAVMNIELNGNPLFDPGDDLRRILQHLTGNQDRHEPRHNAER